MNIEFETKGADEKETWKACTVYLQMDKRRGCAEFPPIYTLFALSGVNSTQSWSRFPLLCYADDTQLFVPIKPGLTHVSSSVYLTSKTGCPTFFLQLNDSESDVFLSLMYDCK